MTSEHAGNKPPAAYYIRLYLVSLVAFFAVDMIWLVLVARSFYARQIGYLMAPDVNWTPALIFYGLYVAAVLIFVVLPGLRAGNLRSMLVKAAFFGLVAYATYDLTNLATVKDWPLTVTLVDLVWGMVLTSLVSLAGYFAGRKRS